ncbi:MAG: hypothetical protein ACK5PQ_02835 [Alphaproteobacteria bacterium]
MNFLIHIPLLLILTLPALSRNLGYCPKDSFPLCGSSLAEALKVVTNCPLDKPETKKCAFILIQTLSEADHKAPFFETFYEKDFEVGDVENYKKEVQSLKEYSPKAWLVLHNLSKVLILNYTTISTLSPDQKRSLENLLQPLFEREEKRDMDLNDDAHIQDLIKRVIKEAKAIKWDSSQNQIAPS